MKRQQNSEKLKNILRQMLIAFGEATHPQAMTDMGVLIEGYADDAFEAGYMAGVQDAFEEVEE